MPRGRFKFQVTPVGMAHKAMDPPLIAHCVTLFPMFPTRAFAATVATRTAAPLDSPKDVTDAESGPGLGCVAKTTVSDVDDAAEIEPTVPLISVTKLPAAGGSKLNPLMTSVVWVELIVAELEVTTGGARTVATTIVPLDSPKAVTVAESGPRLGCVAKTIVSDVIEAAEKEATVPLLSVTTWPAADGSKLNPLMTSVIEATERLAELGVTIGLGLLGTTTNPMEEV